MLRLCTLCNPCIDQAHGNHETSQTGSAVGFHCHLLAKWLSAKKSLACPQGLAGTRQGRKNHEERTRLQLREGKALVYWSLALKHE